MEASPFPWKALLLSHFTGQTTEARGIEVSSFKATQYSEWNWNVSLWLIRLGLSHDNPGLCSVL